MALLMLWELDHGQSFPKQGGEKATASLLGFTKRLQSRVKADEELRSWLTCKQIQKPLAPGLPAVHHMRWSVKIVPPRPSEPQGWYDEFVQRWRAYLEELAQSATPSAVAPHPPMSEEASSSTMAVLPPVAVVAEEPAPGVARRRHRPRRLPQSTSSTRERSPTTLGTAVVAERPKKQQRRSPHGSEDPQRTTNPTPSTLEV